MSIKEAIAWIEDNEETALSLLETWVNINSGSHNLSGLQLTLEALKKAFAPLGTSTEEIPLKNWEIKNEQGEHSPLKLGKVLRVSKSASGIKILLGGHMDTVYPPGTVPKEFSQSGEILKGPGVADMKGGLAVLWLALSAFEKYRGSLSLSWEVLISSDEELGSPGSAPLWEESGKKNQWGLLFEPAQLEGAIVTERKGSITFSLVCKGKAAHVGRAMHEGKSAVLALAKFIILCYAEMSRLLPKVSLNISQVKGGEALNVVPALAYCRINARSFDQEALNKCASLIHEIAEKIGKEEGVKFQLDEEGFKSAKLFDKKTEALFHQLELAADEVGLVLKKASSGGLSDGNILQDAGLPTLDSLGVVGGNLHTPEEWMEKNSLVERAKLTCHLLFLMAEKDP